MPKKISEAQIQLYLRTLRDTPQCLIDCARGLDEDRLKRAVAPGEWSFCEVLAHLRGCQDVWSYSICAMLILDNPELAFIHPREWSKIQGYTALSFAENLEAFTVGRDNLLRILQSLSFEEWGRSARFTGKANIYTIFGETLRMALHEEDHCQ